MTKTVTLLRAGHLDPRGAGLIAFVEETHDYVEGGHVMTYLPIDLYRALGRAQVLAVTIEAVSP